MKINKLMVQMQERSECIAGIQDRFFSDRTRYMEKRTELSRYDLGLGTNSRWSPLIRRQLRGIMEFINAGHLCQISQQIAFHPTAYMNEHILAATYYDNQVVNLAVHLPG
jgi:hypothetical protein